jgi:hypothetical protein
LVDPGSNLHFAFNPTGGETVVIASFIAGKLLICAGGRWPLPGSGG